MPAQFNFPDEITIINASPEYILQTPDGVTRLWAVSLTGGSVQVNMKSPRLIRELKRLAQEGGGSNDIGDVRWEFLSRESPSLLDRYAVQAYHAHGNFGIV